MMNVLISISFKAMTMVLCVCFLRFGLWCLLVGGGSTENHSSSAKTNGDFWSRSAIREPRIADMTTEARWRYESLSAPAAITLSTAVVGATEVRDQKASVAVAGVSFPKNGGQSISSLRGDKDGADSPLLVCMPRQLTRARMDSRELALE